MTQARRYEGLDPFWGDSPEILILGTFPGEESLRLAKEGKFAYYGSRRNDFWKLVSGDMRCQLDDCGKEKLLNKKHIALWDIYSEVDREGSADAHIKSGKYNDILGELAKHPTIRKVLVNGKGQHQTRFFKQLDVKEKEQLSSSSCANRRTITFQEKLEEWQEAINL